MQIDGKNIKIEDNGQVMIEREPGFWVHYDMKYHIRAELVEGGVRAALYDYLDQLVELSEIEVSFQIDGEESVIKTEAGVATLLDDRPVSYAYISSSFPGIRPVDIGEPPKPLDEVSMLGEQLVQRELEVLELKSENSMLGQQFVNLELRLLALEGGATANE